MFRGDWYRDRAPVIIAIIGGSITVALYWAIFYNAGYSSGLHEQSAHVASERYARDAAEHIKRECGFGTAAEQSKCIREIVEAEREAERNQSDLQAQWKAADWVLWAEVIGGAQLLISAFGLYALLETIKQGRKALRRAREANRIARKTARQELRAYVGFDGVKYTPIFDQDYKIIKVRIASMFKNSGSTPAKIISVSSAIQYFPKNEAQDAWTIEDNWDAVPKMAETALWPSKGVNLEDLEKSKVPLQMLIPAYKGKQRLLVKGAIWYTDVFGAKHITTQVTEIAVRLDPQTIEFAKCEGDPDYIKQFFVETPLEVTFD